jgi:hypothetical protein
MNMPPDTNTGNDGKKPASKPQRGPRGAFLPGNKEGATGRPKGSRNRTTLMIEAMLAGEAEALTRALIGKAKKGFAVPLQLVFERLAPPRKDRYVEFDLPPVATAADVAAAQAAILSAIAGGILTPAEGQGLAGLLELRRRAIETVEMETRLKALEERAAQAA